MISPRNTFFALALVAGIVIPRGSAAQTIYLRAEAGRITLRAENASAHEILREWARVTGGVVINADKAGSTPLTLRLEDVAVRTAMATILRGVGGFILGERRDAAGAAVVDRILILPSSTLAAAASGDGTPRANTPPVGPLVGPFSAAAQASAPPSDPDLPPGFSRDEMRERLRFFETAPSERVGRVSGLGSGSNGETFDPTFEEDGRSRHPQRSDATVEAPPPPDPTQVDVPLNPFGVKRGSSQPGTLAPVQRNEADGNTPQSQ